MKTETDSSPKPPTVDVGSLARGSAVPDYSLMALNNLAVLLKMALEKLNAPADVLGAHEDADTDAVLGFLEKDGPHYALVGYNDNGTPCAAITVYAASAGRAAVEANGVLMMHDAGYPQVKRATAISLPPNK